MNLVSTWTQKHSANHASFLQHYAHAAIFCLPNCQASRRAISSPLLMGRKGSNGYRIMGPFFTMLDLWCHLDQFYQIPPMKFWVPEAGTELPPRALVASPEQVAAANRRRKNTVPGRFVCNLCPQNFTAKHNLKNHINSHFQKKNHRCTAGCGSSFGTRSSLNRHRKKCKSVPST